MVEHGGQSYKKPCEVEGCWQLANKGVYCYKHGEILLQCGGVEKHPQKGGMCKKHFAQAQE